MFAIVLILSFIVALTSAGRAEAVDKSTQNSPAPRIYGRVVDENGKSVSAARVILKVKGQPSDVKESEESGKPPGTLIHNCFALTDSNGRFDFDKRIANYVGGHDAQKFMRHFVTARLSAATFKDHQFARYGETEWFPVATTQKTIRIKPQSGSIAGKLLGEKKLPIKCALVGAVQTQDRDPWAVPPSWGDPARNHFVSTWEWLPHTQVRADGSFNIGGLPSGDYTLVASVPGGPIWESRTISVKPKTTSTIDWEERWNENPRFIRGTIKSTSGDGVVNATIRALDSNGHEVATTKTMWEGGYALLVPQTSDLRATHGVAPTPDLSRLQVVSPSGVATEIGKTSSSCRDLILPMSYVTGEIVFADGTPWFGSILMVWPGDQRLVWDPAPQTARALSSGGKAKFRLGPLLPGRYELMALGNSSPIDVIDVGRGDRELGVVKVVDTGDIRVALVESHTGKVLQRETVRTTEVRGDRRFKYPDQRTVQDGIVILPSMRAGHYIIAVPNPGFADTTIAVDLKPRSTTELKIKLDRSGTINGRILGLSGQPIGAVHGNVTAYPVGLKSSGYKNYFYKSAFQLEVPPGRFVVVVQIPGPTIQTRQSLTGVTHRNESAPIYIFSEPFSVKQGGTASIDMRWRQVDAQHELNSLTEEGKPAH